MKKMLQLLTVLSLLQLSAGNPRLVCQETVVAQIGGNVTLPCQLEPKQNIEHETIQCKRRGDSSQLVYACRNGKQLPDQLAQYKHRTSLDFEDLKIGVLNLNINSVTQSDNGTYQLYIRKWKIYSTVTLVVGVPPPGVPPPDKVIAVDVPVVPIVLGAIVLGAIVLGVVLFLVKPKWIQRCWTRMMKRRALKSQHDDEEPHRAAGNGHLDLKQLAERETMLK